MASLQTTMAAFNAAIARNSDGYEFRLLLRLLATAGFPVFVLT
jgi:hypothetical protein